MSTTVLWMTCGRAAGQRPQGPGPQGARVGRCPGSDHPTPAPPPTLLRAPGPGPPASGAWGGRYLQGQQVALQAVSDEDGVGTEHAQQDGLDVPERDARVGEVSLGHP